MVEIENELKMQRRKLDPIAMALFKTKFENGSNSQGHFSKSISLESFGKLVSFETEINRQSGPFENS